MKIDNHIFDELEKIYGSHSNVARKLKITARHYRLIRNKNGGSDLAKTAIKTLYRLASCDRGC